MVLCRVFSCLIVLLFRCSWLIRVSSICLVESVLVNGCGGGVVVLGVVGVGLFSVLIVLLRFESSVLRLGLFIVLCICW